MLTDTARLHAAAWKRLFDAFLRRRATALGEPFLPFDPRRDYLAHVDGRPRADGVRAFLASRGIRLPDGSDSVPAEAETVAALARCKDRLFARELEAGAEPAAGAAVLLERWITPEDAELERAAAYTFHSAVAERWRDGPLLIAGDSAHQTPPFLGQGMCAGIRDAANLAWKLVRVLRGQAGDALLDSYESERAPHVRAYIELAVRLGGLINTKAMGAAVPASALDGGGPAHMETIKPPLGPGLAAGWHGLTGRLAPQPRLADGARLDDRVGGRFAALLRPAFAAALPPALRERLAAADVAVVADDAPELQDWLRAAEAEAVLVRPDRYVLGAARTPQEMEALAAAV